MEKGRQPRPTTPTTPSREILPTPRVLGRPGVETERRQSPASPVTCVLIKRMKALRWSCVWAKWASGQAGGRPREQGTVSGSAGPQPTDPCKRHVLQLGRKLDVGSVSHTPNWKPGGFEGRHLLWHSTLQTSQKVAKSCESCENASRAVSLQDMIQ